MKIIKRIAITIFSLSANLATAMTDQEFLLNFAKCSYPYFSAGLKWDVPENQLKAVINNFGKNLQGVMDLSDAPLNNTTLTELCAAYKDTSVPQKFNKSDFEDAMEQSGFGAMIKALKDSR